LGLVESENSLAISNIRCPFRLNYSGHKRKQNLRSFHGCQYPIGFAGDINVRLAAVPDLRQLEESVRASQQAFYDLRKQPWDAEALRIANERVLAAQSALAASRSEPYAVRIDIEVEVGSEAVRLFQSEQMCLLMFSTFTRSEKQIIERGYALVEFE